MHIKYMKMKKANKKILEATEEVLKEKERQRLYEEAKPHFKDEWDAIEWELDHPSKELCDAVAKMAEIGKTLDLSGVPTEVGKL